MKLVFCGTPQFAVPTLLALIDAGHEIDLVLTQPDRPSGRGMQLVAPPVKQIAEPAGLAILQPEKIKSNEELRALLTAIDPDAIVVVGYGRIIPKWMLDLPRYGNINLHGSLLPKYRGAAPIQWAIARGETITGVTTMRLDEGLDTGDMLLQREVPVGPAETSEDLYPKLSQIGAEVMIQTLAGLAKGSIRPEKQDASAASLAPILTREDGLIDFSLTAKEIYDRWRGFQPWPGAWTTVRGLRLAVHKLRIAPEIRSNPTPPEVPGEIRFDLRMELAVACGDGTWIELLEVQLEGRKRISARDFLNGSGLQPGERLGR